MAKPPELITEVIPPAAGAVLARVVRVVKQDPQEKRAPSLETSLPTTAARQIVEVEVQKVLFGALGKDPGTLQLIKPEGAYALAAGHHGPFLLAQGEQGIEILGRYGPDTWSEATIVSASRGQ